MLKTIKMARLLCILQQPTTQTHYVVKALISAGAKVNAKGGIFGLTPLYYAMHASTQTQM